MALSLTINGVKITNPADISKWEIANGVEDAVQNRLFDAQRTRQPASDIAAIRQELAEASAKVAAIENVIVPNARAASAPPNSTGQTTAQAQNARDTGANTQNPPGPPLTTGPNGRVQPAATPTPTNAQRPSTTPTAGTNAPTVASSATQAVPAPTATPNLSQSAGTPGSPPTLPAPGPVASAARTSGVAAGINEPAGNDVLARLQTLFNTSDTAIKTQPNALTRYSSYTYNISIHILKPEQYNTFINTKNITVPNGQLLMSSGGAPLSANSQTPTNNNAQTGSAANQPGQNIGDGRSQFFPLDYYLDDVKIESIQQGKGTRSAHNVNKIAFKIVEPNGISLLDNLYKATEAIMGDKPNYGAQIYLMVVKFLGYDQNGNLGPAMGIDPKDPNKTTKPIIKYIPFLFTSIKFRMSNKLTEYTCEAMAVQNQKASGQALGTIPYNVELTAETMQDIFNAGSVIQTTFNPATPSRSSTDTASTDAADGVNQGPRGQPAAPPKASAAPKPTITQGIITAMNEYEQQQVDEGFFDEPNTYELIFTDSILAEASIVPPGETDKNNTPMGPSNPTAAQQLNPATGSVNTKAKNSSATAGTTLLQFIDNTLAASTYLSKQQNAVIDPVTGKSIPQKTTASVMGWWRIGLQAKPIAYDTKRNDYAYAITYEISPYLVNDVKSPYFPQSKFRGVHKSYKYWFTGENTEILDYNQEFNYLYYTVINSKQPSPMEQTADYRYAEYVMHKYQTKSNESVPGSSVDVTEPAAQAKDNLYSPGDLGKCHLTIMGDPSWIFQGELGLGVAQQFGLGTRTVNYDPYLEDGTINREAEEVLFEVQWSKPVDYSLETGLIEPGQTRYGANNPVTTIGSKAATQSYIYRALTVSSLFSKGKFTQELEGAILLFPLNSVKKNTAADDDDAALGAAMRANAAAAAAGTRGTATWDAGGAPASVNAAPALPSNATGSRSSQANQAAATPTTPDTVRPAPPAQPPTSGGQPVGAANPASPTNAQTGGTRTTQETTTTYDANVFRTKDPASFAKFQEYEQQQRNLITQSETARLSAQAKANNPNGEITPDQRRRIATSASITASARSTANAVQQFLPQITAAGAGGTTTTNTPANVTPVNTAAGQTQVGVP